MMTSTMSLAKDLPTDLKDLPTQRDLPDLFTFNDGKKVKNLENWKERRQELIRPLMFYQYGSMPPKPDQVMFRTDKEKNHSSGIGKEIWKTLIIDSKKKLEMRLVIYKPNTPGPHPVIIEEEGSKVGLTLNKTKCHLFQIASAAVIKFKDGAKLKPKTEMALRIIFS